MAEFIDTIDLPDDINDGHFYYYEIPATSQPAQIIAEEAQPFSLLSVVAEHIKNRLYETALNTEDEKASEAIGAMAERIDFWIDELKDGDTE